MSRKEWIASLIKAFQDGDKIEVFGEEKQIYNYNWACSGYSGIEYTFDFLNGDSIILKVYND